MKHTCTNKIPSTAMLYKCIVLIKLLFLFIGTMNAQDSAIWKFKYLECQKRYSQYASHEIIGSSEFKNVEYCLLNIFQEDSCNQEIRQFLGTLYYNECWRNSKNRVSRLKFRARKKQKKKMKFLLNRSIQLLKPCEEK
jgi:hypothetical protein